MRRAIQTSEQALAFVCQHGVVLASAKGPVPRLIDAIAGETIQGSWWAHPQSHAIFTVLEAVADSNQVLVCRLVGGKVTLVHRRLWPALVRLADRFSPEQLAQVRQEHTPSGRHINRELDFPQWAPAQVAAQAKALTTQQALALLGGWVAAQKA